MAQEKRQLTWWKRESAREGVRVLLGVLGTLSRTLLAIAIFVSG